MSHDAAQSEFLGVDELASLLDVSRASIYRLVERRLIRFYRLPRHLRFRRSDVEAYLERCLVRPMNEYEREKNQDQLVGRSAA